MFSPNDQQALFVHSAAFHRAEQAALPHPLFDLNPRLTAALHSLWASMRPLISLGSDTGYPGLARTMNHPNLTIGGAFQVFGATLVSFHYSASFCRFNS